MTRRLHLSIGVVALSLLLVAAAALVLPACGLLGGISVLRVEFCPRPKPTVPVATSDGRERRLALEARLAQLQRQLDGRVCEPVGVVEPVPGESPPDIVEEEWRNEEIGLLEGCWNLDSDYSLRDVDTGAVSEVETWEMCFDTEGHGRQTLIYETGDRCASSVSAEFRQGQLIILDPSDVECDNGRVIYRREATCDLEQDGTARCISRQPELRDGTSSQYQLRR